MSLVLVCPSTLMQLNVSLQASRKIDCKSAGRTAASVSRKPSIVAMFGPIIAAPLANPAIVAPPTRTLAVLATVSVVRIACAASAKASTPARAARAATGMPASRTAIGSGRPITPVLATSTSAGSQCSSRARSSAMRRASSRPWSPVQALALPEQTTKPRVESRPMRCRLTCTGAAQTRFCVKTPADAAGRSDTTTHKSRRSGSVRSLATTPAKR